MAKDIAYALRDNKDRYLQPYWREDEHPRPFSLGAIPGALLLCRTKLIEKNSTSA